MFRSRPVSLALVGLFVWSSACTSYRQIEVGEVADHDHIRVTIAEGERLLMTQPTVIADSITGRSEKGKLTAIALDNVEALEGSYTSTGKTASLVFGVVLVLAVVAAVAATCLDGGGLGPSWDC